MPVRERFKIFEVAFYAELATNILYKIVSKSFFYHPVKLSP